MSQRRSYIAAAELGGLVYAAGGMVGETGRPLATFARYEPERGPLGGAAAAPGTRRGRPRRAAIGRTRVRRRWDDRGREHGRDLGLRPARGRWTRASAAARAAVQPRRSRARREAVRRSAGYVGGRERRERLRLRARDATAGRSSTRLPRPNARLRGWSRSDDELWVIGGRRGEEILREVWILDPATRALAARARLCRGRWSFWVPRWPGTRSTPCGSRRTRSTTPRSGRWRRGPATARHETRTRGIRGGRRALHRRRLHDRAQRQPGRRASAPGLSRPTDPRWRAMTIRCTSFVPSPISRIFWSR